MTSVEVAPIEMRGARYATLFRGELPYEPLPDDAEIGIAGLCRITRRSGRHATRLQAHLDTLPDIVNDILIEHDLTAMDIHRDSAVFAFSNDGSRERVTSIVQNIFTQWEITSYNNKLDVLLPSKDSQTKWLVIEAAAAVMTVGTAENGFKLDEDASDRSRLATIIASWGPGFVRQWMDGTVLMRWMKEQAIPETEQAEWLKNFTPNLRKYFAVNNVANPLEALLRVQYNLEVVLTDANIADSLGCSAEMVAKEIHSSLRKHFAIHNIADPLKGLLDWADGRIGAGSAFDIHRDVILNRILV